jgi:hypothetical protein
MGQGYSYSGSAYLKGRVRITDLVEPPTDSASGSVAVTRNYVDQRTGMVGYGDTSAAPQPFDRYQAPFTTVGGVQHVAAGGSTAGDEVFLVTCSNNGNGTMVHSMASPFNPTRLFQDTNASLGSVIITNSRVSSNPASYSTAIVLSAVGSAFRRILLNYANVTMTNDAITVPTGAVHLSTDTAVTSPAIPVGGPRLYVSRGASGISLYNLPSLPTTTLNNPAVNIAGTFNVSQIYTLTTEAVRYLLCGSSSGLSVYDVTTLTIGAAVASVAVANLTDISQVLSGASKYCYGVSGNTGIVHRVDLAGVPPPSGLAYSVFSATKAGGLYKSVIATTQSGTLRVYACDAQTGNAGPCIDIYTVGLTLTATVRDPSVSALNYMTLNWNSNTIWAGNALGVQGFSLYGLNSLSAFNVDALGRLSVGITRVVTAGETISQNSTCIVFPASIGGAQSYTLSDGAVSGHVRLAVNLASTAQQLVAGANKVYDSASFALNKTNINLTSGSSCIMMWEGSGWMLFAEEGGITTT